MTLHTHSLSSLGSESPYPGDYPTSPHSQTPNKTLYIANIFSDTDSAGNNIFFAPLSHILEAQPGFKRLKILTNRNKIGCFAIAYYIDIPSAQTAMAALQGIMFMGCRNGLEISFATAPKTIVIIEALRQGQKAPTIGESSFWAPQSNRSRISTPIKSPLISTTRGPGMLGDKVFIPGYTRGLSRFSHTHMEGSNVNVPPSVVGIGDLVSSRFESRKRPGNEQENSPLLSTYSTKIREDSRERLSADKKAEEDAGSVRSMLSLNLEEETLVEMRTNAEEQDYQEQMERARKKRIEEGFQLEKKKEREIIARGVAELAARERREDQLKEKDGGKIVATSKGFETPIIEGSPVLVDLDESSIGNKVLQGDITKNEARDLHELMREEEQIVLVEGDWMDAFDF